MVVTAWVEQVYFALLCATQEDNLSQAPHLSVPRTVTLFSYAVPHHVSHTAVPPPERGSRPRPACLPHSSQPCPCHAPRSTTSLHFLSAVPSLIAHECHCSATIGPMDLMSLAGARRVQILVRTVPWSGPTAGLGLFYPPVVIPHRIPRWNMLFDSPGRSNEPARLAHRRGRWFVLTRLASSCCGIFVQQATSSGTSIHPLRLHLRWRWSCA